MQRTLLVLLVIVIIVVGFFLVVLAASTLNASTKMFAPYSASVSQSSTQNSLEVDDVNGQINLIPTSTTNVLINGTIIARGLSASTDAIGFVENNSSGRILFRAVFPSAIGLFLFASYTVNINVYFPSQYSSTGRFNSFIVTDTNGNINASTVSATTVKLATTNGNIRASIGFTNGLTITTTNGNVDFSCFSCGNTTVASTNGGITGRFQGPFYPGASYSLSTTNGGVGVMFPSAVSVKLTANTTNGSISTSGLGLAAQLGTSLNATLLSGNANLTLKTVNGSITITGV